MWRFPAACPCFFSGFCPGHIKFANYDKVIAGSIMVAVVVIIRMYFFDRIQKYSLRWQNP